MARFDSPLEGVKVAAPCPADWDQMVGDGRVRFCHSCELNVYNLSGMSRREAEGLVAGAEGRLCVRFFRRADGSILTDDCPVGLRAVRQRAARLVRATVSAALGLFAGLGLAGAPPRRQATVGALVAEPAKYVRAGEATQPPAPAPPIPTADAPVPEMGELQVGRILPSDTDVRDAPRRTAHNGVRRPR